MDYTLEILMTIILLEGMFALALYIEHRLHKLVKRKSKHLKKELERLIET